MRLSAIIFLVIPLWVWGQQESDPQKNFIIEQSIEQIAENLEDENIDYTTLFDQLSYYYDHPIDLNHAKKEDLQQLMLLNEFEINALFDHIEKNGKLISIYELMAIKGYTNDLIRSIMNFVKVDANFQSPHISLKEMLDDGTHEIYFRWTRVLEDQAGYQPCGEFDPDCDHDSLVESGSNKVYLGSPDKIYTRYRFKFAQHVSWGFTAEKDPGEEFFKSSQANGFDFYSAHFYLHDIGKIKNLAVGDFHTQFGQGLTLWSGLAFGKSSFVMNNKRNALGIRPYTSVDENLFMRGGAATIALDDIEITAFYSHKRIDANISMEDTLFGDNEIRAVSSFQTSGLHSTASELFDKNAVMETHYGGHIAYITRKMNLGITAVGSKYDADLTRNLQTYNQFEFDTNANFVVGLDYQYLAGNFNFFGEFSRSQNGAVAFLNGALISLDPKLALSILHRHYPRDYQNLVSNAFADGSKNVNEDGLFIGMEFKPSQHWTMTAYFDQFKSKWLRFGVEKPNNYGLDWLTQVTWKPNKELEIYGRMRHREKPYNTDYDVDDIDFISNREQTNYRLNFTYKVSDAWRLRNRVEYVTWDFEGQRETGYMIYQDVMFNPLSSPLSFNFRYALFDSESYNSRIYAYENDVLYYFSIPAYYYRGTRTYLTVRYQLGDHLDFWVRWSQWYYNDRETILSDKNEINGNTKTELRAQVRLSF